MKLLIVATGARGSGNSYVLARIAAKMPSAAVIEEHAYGVGDSDRLYQMRQHICAPFETADGCLVLRKWDRERLRGLTTVLMASGVENIEAKIVLLQEIGPFEVVFVRGQIGAGVVPDGVGRLGPEIAHAN